RDCVRRRGPSALDGGVEAARPGELAALRGVGVFLTGRRQCGQGVRCSTVCEARPRQPGAAGRRRALVGGIALTATVRAISGERRSGRATLATPPASQRLSTTLNGKCDDIRAAGGRVDAAVRRRLAARAAGAGPHSAPVAVLTAVQIGGRRGRGG